MLKLINRYLSTYSFKEIISSIIWANKNPVTDSYQGKNHLYFSSGSAALRYYLEQNNIKGKIAVPAYTCERVIAAVLEAGCEPFFVDIEMKTGTINSSMLGGFSDKGIVAIIATHIFGMQCDLEEIHTWCRGRNILVIEDRALINPFLDDKESSNADIHFSSFGKGKFINIGFGGVLIEGKHPLAKSSNIKLKKISLLSTLIKIIISSNEFNKVYMKIEFIIKKNLSRRNESTVNLSNVEYSVLPEMFSRMMIFLNEPSKYKLRIQHCKSLCKIYMSNIVQGDDFQIPQGIHIENHKSSFFPIFCSGRNDLLDYFKKRNVDLAYFFNYCIGEIIDSKVYKNGNYYSSNIVLLPLHMNVSEKDALMISAMLNEWSSCNINK